MDARQLLHSGNPRGALEVLKQEVRRAPRDATLRIFLFQLFCVLGAWDRALVQLSVAAELDPQARPMAEDYRALIGGEIHRERVFAGTATPALPPTPQSWISLLLEANKALIAGAFEPAAALRDAAFDQATATPGDADGAPFEWIADADSRLGPVIEAIIDGAYSWLPMQSVRCVRTGPPTDLRDLVWLPAQFLWAGGGETPGFIPARYPGSASADDPMLALGRRTEWAEPDGGEFGWVIGRGQRVFTTGDTDYALLDLRRLTLQSAGLDGAEAPAPGAL